MGFGKRAMAREAAEQASIRPVWMQFAYDHTVRLWRVKFRYKGETTSLPRILYFADAEKLRTLYARFGAKRMVEDRLALESAINAKRGAVELMLGEAQLSKLRTGKQPTLNTERGIYK